MIHVLVVVYNKNAESSETCKSLLRQTSESFRVYLWDNSETDFGLESYCLKHDWTYLGGKGNIGLSKAYNAALEEIKANGDCRDWFCPLDDDTELPESYFEEAEEYMTSAEADILLPIVYSGEKIISPWRESIIKYRRFLKNEMECLTTSDDLLAFNSGMLIPVSVYEETGLHYDERLFLDGVDISFLREAKKNGIKQHVFPARLSHNFSACGTPSEEYAVKRFTNFASDTKILFGRNQTAGRITILKRAIHLTLQYRRLKFITIALRFI